MSDAALPPTVDDRRSQRTRAALRQALLSLLHERNWDEIDVQAVCERANVGRSTFYTHYPNKDALLNGGFDDLRRTLHTLSATAVAAPGSRPTLRFARGLIEHAWENRVIFRRLIGRRSGYVVHQRFKAMLEGLIDSELPQAVPEVPREALVRWYAGAFFELLAWWVDSGNPTAPDALLETLERLLDCRLTACEP